MKRILAILVSVLVLIPVTSGCSGIRIDLAGRTETAMIPLSGVFSRIEIEDAIKVIYTNDCDEAIIETDANVLSLVMVYEDNGTLKIGYSRDFKVKGNKWNSLETVVKVPYTEGLNSVEASGASIFISDLSLNAKDIYIEASGAARISCPAEASENIYAELSGASTFSCKSMTGKKLYLDASGASSLKASGSVNEGSVMLSGASCMEGYGNSDIYSLRIDRCSGTLSGASTARFASDISISCTLTGASNIYYIGTADTRMSEEGDSSHIYYMGPDIF